MSTLSIIITILHIVGFWICKCAIVQQSFYSIEWTSSIPDTDNIGADTFNIREIALYSNGKKLDIVPSVTGIADPSVLMDGDYRDNKWTYPIQHKFSVQFDFNGTLIPIDWIVFVTNCGE